MKRFCKREGCENRLKYYQKDYCCVTCRNGGERFCECGNKLNCHQKYYCSIDCRDKYHGREVSVDVRMVEPLVIKDFETCYHNTTPELAKRYGLSEFEVSCILDRYFAKKKNFRKLA